MTYEEQEKQAKIISNHNKLIWSRMTVIFFLIGMGCFGLSHANLVSPTDLKCIVDIPHYVFLTMAGVFWFLSGIYGIANMIEHDDR